MSFGYCQKYIFDVFVVYIVVNDVDVILRRGKYVIATMFLYF